VIYNASEPKEIWGAVKNLAMRREVAGLSDWKLCGLEDGEDFAGWSAATTETENQDDTAKRGSRRMAMFGRIALMVLVCKKRASFGQATKRRETLESWCRKGRVCNTTIARVLKRIEMRTSTSDNFKKTKSLTKTKSLRVHALGIAQRE